MKLSEVLILYFYFLPLRILSLLTELAVFLVIYFNLIENLVNSQIIREIILGIGFLLILFHYLKFQVRFKEETE